MLSMTESVFRGLRKDRHARTLAPSFTASASRSAIGYAYRSART